MRWLVKLSLLITIFACKADDAIDSDELVPLVINDTAIEVELADEQHERTLGLMHRESLCNDCGMLFKFDRIRVVGMWMKNTHIPLDVAYINAFGRITDIKPLEPQDLTTVPSSVPVLFALEMNQGWFEKNGIGVGDTVEIPSELKR
ncbi:MAG: DUF192 domain-containing protein [Pseudomonadota bacterium]